jgi:GTP-binding protein
LLDEELVQMLSQDLPQDLPVIFISAVAQKGLTELKDILWTALNSESNKIASITQEESIVHRNKDLGRLQQELEYEGEDQPITIDDIQDIEDLDDDDIEWVDLED